LDAAASLLQRGGASTEDAVPFEMVVLDKALNATTKKFNRHLRRYRFNVLD